jgi:hypothetical protein
MATIKVLQGFSKIKDSYNIINENDQAINNQLVSHVNGTADKHNASNVVFTPIPNVTSTEVQGAITQVNTRVSNIIASSGTSSTEVVDARLSPTYGTFTTLKSRLDNADVRIEKTEKPVQQSVSLTELTQIQSVTDSYNGIAETEIGSATALQVVVNGDFSGGTDGWSAIGSNLSVDDKILKITGSGSTAGVMALGNIGLISAGTKIFAKVRVRITTNNTPNLWIQLERVDTAAWLGNLAYQMSAIENNWYEMRGFFTLTETTNVGIRIQHQYADATTANGKVMEVDGNVGVFTIPLTGTPYESYTADQMNALVNTYWEGLRSTQSVELGSRGRNLFDGVLDKGSIDTGTGATVDFNEYTRTVNFTRVKGNTVYSLMATGLVTPYVFFYTNRGDYITFTIGATFLTPQNCGLIKIVWIDATILTSNVMLNEGSTALPYEEGRFSEVKITCQDSSKFDLAMLPNGVSNTITFGM